MTANTASSYGVFAPVAGVTQSDASDPTRETKRLHLMPSAATRKVGEAAVQRLSGSRPGPVGAFIAAAIVGVAAATVTYRALRSGR